MKNEKSESSFITLFVDTEQTRISKSRRSQLTENQTTAAHSAHVPVDFW